MKILKKKRRNQQKKTQLIIHNFTEGNNYVTGNEIRDMKEIKEEHE